MGVSWLVDTRPAGRVVSQFPRPGIDVGGEPDSVWLNVSTGLRSTGRPAAEFRTTAGAVYCQVNSASEVSYSLVCWTPNDGYMIEIYPTSEFQSRPVYVRRARGAKPGGFRTIGYGGSWRRHGIRCVARRTGLTCRNTEGHGFWLGRYHGVRHFSATPGARHWCQKRSGVARRMRRADGSASRTSRP